jgi:hypothetical protein
VTSQPASLLEVLYLLGFKKTNYSEYIGRRIRELKLLGLNHRLNNLKIAAIKKQSRLLKITLAADNYSLLCEAYCNVSELKACLRKFFEKPIIIKLIIGND